MRGMKLTVDRRALLPVALLAVALATVLPGPAMSARGEERERGGSAPAKWIEVQLAELVSHRTNPPRAARSLALVSVAMRDATRVSKGHRDAAVAGAASTVLSYVFPDRAGAFEELARREHPRNAVDLGRKVGERVVARARTDGSEAVVQGTIPVGPGLWVPTPPGFLTPLEPSTGTWRTWNIASGSQLRPGPPTAFGTAAYAVETREVYDVGRSLTAEQKRIADFWADGPGTVTPPATGTSSRSTSSVRSAFPPAPRPRFSPR